MSWVKKGNIIAVLVVLALVVLFSRIFLDPLLKRALISGGQAAASAKVEIDDVETHLFKGQLLITRVAVADKNAPMKNLIELESARLEFKPSALIRAKAVVRDAAVDGIRFGTPRRTSGALPRSAKPSKMESLVRSAIGPQVSEAVSQTKKAVSGDLDVKQLKSLAGLDAAEAKAKEVEERWKARVDELKKVDSEVAEIRKSIESIGKGGGSPADIAAKIKAAQDAQARLKALQAQVAGTRKDLDADLAQVKGALAKADELRKADLQGLLAAAGVPSFDAESLTRRLLGPELAKRLSTGLDWVHWARRKSSAAAGPKTEERPRRKGINVEFPLPGEDPELLIERASLAGTLAGIGGGPVAFRGTLKGATSNPPLYGKPATLVLEGGAGAVKLSLAGLLDQTKEPGGLKLDFDYAGLPLSGLALGDGQFSAGVAAGSARVRGRLSLVGESWDGEALIDAGGLKLQPKVDLTGAAGRAATAALSSVAKLQAKIGISGTGENLKLSLSSDLGATLAAALKGAATAELQAQSRELEKKLDALYGGRAAALRGQAGGLEKTFGGLLEGQSQLLQKALQEAASKAAGGGVDKLFKGLFPR